MKLMKTLIAGAISLAVIPAMAYEAGDIMVKAGVINVSPKSDSGVDGVEVKDDTQLAIALTYMVTDKVGVEVLGATPFEHDIEVNGTKAGSTKHLPPTVSAQYYPLEASSAIQPYVGLGINHTFFFDEELGGADLHLGKSWGLAYSAGCDYNFDDKLMAGIAIYKMDIDAEIGDSGTDVEIDPTAIMITGGYKF